MQKVGSGMKKRKGNELGNSWLSPPGGVLELVFWVKICFLELWIDLGLKSPKARCLKHFWSIVDRFLKLEFVFCRLLKIFSASLHSYCLTGCTTAPMSTKIQNKTAAKSKKLPSGIPQDLRLRPEAQWRGGRRQVGNHHINCLRRIALQTILKNERLNTKRVGMVRTLASSLTQETTQTIKTEMFRFP